MFCRIVVSVSVAAALAAYPLHAQKKTSDSRTPGKTSTVTSPDEEWHFVVSGDSRNCGDLVMPAIAADAAKYHPAFYWHLGDLRAIYELDEDFAGELNQDGKLRVWDTNVYVNAAWDDFIQMQIQPFQQRNIPFVLGIGNHETISPMSRDHFIAKFAQWLDTPMLHDQRMKDAKAAADSGKALAGSDAEAIHAYYHWIIGDVDFIYLDNSTAEQFDQSQMAWLNGRLESDRTNPGIHTIVVGMHKALPGSLSNFHSMSETPAGEQSGRCAYKKLEEIQRQGHKQVYVLSSHSHFVMTNIYDTPFWREHAPGILSGILVGTAGAVRYRLPASVKPSGSAAECTRNEGEFCAETDVYGYLLATVNGKGKPGAIVFQFKEIDAKDVPDDVRRKFAPDTMNTCFQGNKEMTPAVDTTQYLPDGPCPY
jgi:hypothetical protein